VPVQPIEETAAVKDKNSQCCYHPHPINIVSSFFHDYFIEIWQNNVFPSAIRLVNTGLIIDSLRKNNKHKYGGFLCRILIGIL
jgi:hypothetical protein